MAAIPCCLCGEPIPENPVDPGYSVSDEHVPPLQFYPKAMRPELRERLWKVPSHRRCNGSYQKDEDYFYHRFSPLVGFQNETMGKLILDDIKRRMKKPQTPVLVRHMLKECKKVTPGGIILPEGLVRVEYDQMRIERVVVKVGQCLFHKDHQRFMPRKNCQHIEFCQDPKDLQAIFVQLWQTEMQSVEPNVFSCWHADWDGQHYYSMLFWNSFMFCMIFQDPAVTPLVKVAESV